MRLQPSTAWPSPQALPDEVKPWAVDLTRVLSATIQQEALYRQQIRIIFSTEAELLASSGALGQEAFAQDTANWYKWNGTAWNPLFVAGSSAAKHNLLSDIQGGSAAERYHLTLAQHTALTAQQPFGVGRVLWANAANQVAHDANLLWDFTNKWLGIGCTPAYPLDVVGTASVGTGVGDGGDALRLDIERAWAFQQEGTGGSTGLRLRCLPLSKPFSIDTDSVTYFRTSAGIPMLLMHHIQGWIWMQPTATPLSSNAYMQQSSTHNTLCNRMGDTITRFGGTVKNVDSALAEFESQTNLVQTMWSDTVDKDLWVTGKPVNIFAICRYRLPAYDAGAAYTVTVEILLGTEVLVERTISHSAGSPGTSGYYHVELRSRVTKYAGTSLRNVAGVKQSAVVPLASWVEGAKLALTEYAESRAAPVTEDVTTANVTLQVRVTFSRQVAGLRCVLMDGGWGPETPVV